jgi:hypothetical protein
MISRSAYVQDFVRFLPLADSRSSDDPCDTEPRGAEKNPLIQVFMSIGPVKGIIYAKIVVLLFAIGCSISRKRKPLHWANVVFAGIVVWNLVVITALLPKR